MTSAQSVMYDVPFSPNAQLALDAPFVPHRSQSYGRVYYSVTTCLRRKAHRPSSPTLQSRHLTHSPRLSNAFRTRSKLLNHATSNCGSLIFACIGVIFTFGLNALAVFAATYTVGTPATVPGEALSLSPGILYACRKFSSRHNAPWPCFV